MPGLIEQIDALEPGILRVFRDSDADIGFRESLIFLDDKLIGRVDFKQIFEIRVHPGVHTLYAFNRVLKSERITFEVKPAERVNFLVANTGGLLFTFGMMLGMGIPRIRLQLEIADPLEGTHRKSRKRQMR